MLDLNVPAIFRGIDIGKVFVGKCALWRTVAYVIFRPYMVKIYSEP